MGWTGLSGCCAELGMLWFYRRIPVPLSENIKWITTLVQVTISSFNCLSDIYSEHYSVVFTAAVWYITSVCTIQSIHLVVIHNMGAWSGWLYSYSDYIIISCTIIIDYVWLMLIMLLLKSTCYGVMGCCLMCLPVIFHGMCRREVAIHIIYKSLCLGIIF